MNELHERIQELASRYYHSSVIDLRTHKLRAGSHNRYIYTAPDGTEYYSIARAAEATGKTCQTVRNWSKSGRNGWSQRVVTSQEDIAAIEANDVRYKHVVSPDGVEYRCAGDAAKALNIPTYRVVLAAQQEIGGWRYK